jgi:two-component system alkaline phosphatase synthesis response regulator PhoP
VVVGEEAISETLMKRIQVHLREMKPLWSVTGKVRLGDNVVDFDRREVWRDGIVRQLPGILYDLLKYFVDNSDHIISREELLRSRIWADSICTPAKEGGKTFDVNMSKL